MGVVPVLRRKTLLKLKTTPLKTFKKHPKKTFKKRLDKCNFLVYNGYKEKRTNVLFCEKPFK